MSEHAVGWRFDDHTTPHEERGGSWRTLIRPELSGFGGTHGGHLAALALRTMQHLVAGSGRPPRSLTVHFLAPVEPGPVELTPRLERSGSSMASASVRLEQDGGPVALALASFGRPRPSLEHAAAAMPAVPPPERCQTLVEKPVPDAFGMLVEHRLAAPPLPLSGGDRAEIVFWMRLVEDRPIDALSACMLADAAVPALYGRLDRFVPAPTTDLTVHYAGVAEAPDRWVLGAFRTCWAADGYAIEEGDLWAANGRLLPRTHQLRRILGDRREPPGRKDA